MHSTSILSPDARMQWFIVHSIQLLSHAERSPALIPGSFTRLVAVEAISSPAHMSQYLHQSPTAVIHGC